MRVFFKQAVKVGRCLRRYVFVVIVHVIAVYRFQHQHYNAVVACFRLCLFFALAHNAQLLQNLLVLHRQRTLLNMAAADDFIGIKQHFAKKVYVYGHGKHIAVGFARFFAFNLRPHAHVFFHYIAVQAAHHHVANVKRQRKRRHAHQRPYKVRFLFGGLVYTEQKHKQHKPRRNKRKFKRAHAGKHALNGIYIKVGKKHALHVHAGLPKIKGVKNYNNCRQKINGKIHRFHGAPCPFVVAHSSYKHRKNIVVKPGKYCQRRYNAAVQPQLMHHKRRYAKVQNAGYNYRKITLHPVADTRAAQIQKPCHAQKQHIAQKAAYCCIPELHFRERHYASVKFPRQKIFGRKGNNHKHKQPVTFSHLLPALRQKVNRLGIHLY